MLFFAPCTQAHGRTSSSSLFLAQWEGGVLYRDPPECRSPKVICLDAVADIRFGDVHTLSGPGSPQSFSATVTFHSEPRRNMTVLGVARIDVSGRRVARVLDLVRPDETTACFSVERAQEFDLGIPQAATRRGDGYCIPVM
jgi:hypothetical protein